MVLKIISIICTALISFSVGAFMAFVIFKLKKIDANTDSIPKHHWGMTVYMDDIPQVGPNTKRLGYAIVAIYEGCDYSELPIPHKGEKVSGVYYIDENKVEMTGIVDSVHYNTGDDWIIVRCKCIDVKEAEE